MSEQWITPEDSILQHLRQREQQDGGQRAPGTGHLPGDSVYQVIADQGAELELLRAKLLELSIKLEHLESGGTNHEDSDDGGSLFQPAQEVGGIYLADLTEKRVVTMIVEYDDSLLGKELALRWIASNLQSRSISETKKTILKEMSQEMLRPNVSRMKMPELQTKLVDACEGLSEFLSPLKPRVDKDTAQRIIDLGGLVAKYEVLPQHAWGTMNLHFPVKWVHDIKMGEHLNDGKISGARSGNSMARALARKAVNLPRKQR